MNRIKFLGTAGARFVVSKQTRASGGLWLTLDDTNVLIDPGPGSLVKLRSSRPQLNPMDLDGIIVTHRHLDHANDVNAIMEAMTNGGFAKKGAVFAPRDALDSDPVVLQYVRSSVENIEVLQEGKTYHVGSITFSTPVLHHHGVETYGLNIIGKEHTISLITDTKYFNGLETYYTGDILIINVVLLEPKSHIMHLSLPDAERIIATNKPKVAILTHFGMTMLRAKPWELAEELSQKYGVKVLAARDGMNFNLDAELK